MLAGEFRKDLYYRIAAFHIRIPPLRDRIEDLDALVGELLKEIADESGGPAAHLTPAAMSVLRRLHWPGNVRQLRNVLAAANTRAAHREIGVADLSVKAAAECGNSRNAALETAASVLSAALRETGGDKSAAARLLGWSRMRVYRTLKRAAQAHGSAEVGYS
jgi:DNA-binding NtrC family response regulator